MIGTDIGILKESGNMPGRFNIRSTNIAKITNAAVRTANTMTPIGVSNVRVFFVPVAALCRKFIQFFLKSMPASQDCTLLE
jgi:hypothetical protein